MNERIIIGLVVLALYELAIYAIRRKKKMNDNTCVCCGAQIPEGRQICPKCEKGGERMDKYISREDILDIASQYCADDDGSCSKADVDLREMLDEIEALPAADVQPVIHAYWIELPKALNPNENPCKCSSCGHVLSFMNYYPKSKYCDDCGARMDGEKNE